MRTIPTVGVSLIVLSLVGCSSISMPWGKSTLPSDPSAEALYEEGNRQLKDKKYTRAVDAFQKLKTDHPFSPLLTQAELKLADSYYLNQQYPEAITAFKEFQTLHPNNENLAFVNMRLGQAHFDQFTSSDRDQKNTEIAKGYFETVVTNYPNSPYALEAKEKLAKTVEYLSEHEFNVALFYYKQEKYPAARDRFEEIVRKYRDTPTAVKSLYYLGDSYQKEKNFVKASLAYEALVQHYPKSEFAGQEKTQLAQIEKEKQDPLALLLMRDRRPGAVSAPEIKEETALSKLKDTNLIAKNDVVYEEPGADKGLLRRVADKLNPFSSSDDKKKEEKPETATELLAKRKEAEKKESGERIASKPSDTAGTANNFLGQVDESLQQRGVNPATQQAALKPPAIDLPQPEEKPVPQTADTTKLLGSIDSNLQKSGKSVADMPAPPPAAPVFSDPATAQAVAAKTAARSEPPASVSSSGILGSIDQKLNARGVEPVRLPAPPTEGKNESETQTAPAKPNIELEPKLNVEKGPLYLSPSEVPAQSAETESKPEVSDSQPAPVREAPRALVKGPVQAPAATALKPTEQKRSASVQEEELKGVFDSIKDDIDRVGKVLNPFRW